MQYLLKANNWRQELEAAHEKQLDEEEETEQENPSIDQNCTGRVAAATNCNHREAKRQASEISLSKAWKPRIRRKNRPQKSGKDDVAKINTRSRVWSESGSSWATGNLLATTMAKQS